MTATNNQPEGKQKMNTINRNERLATNVTGSDYRAAWLEADAALQKLQSMTRVGDKAEVEIVLARQRLQASQTLVWKDEAE